MVGIGGGVPSEKNDIRLGDIVVSAPRDGEGGVFQYDFGGNTRPEVPAHTDHHPTTDTSPKRRVNHQSSVTKGKVTRSILNNNLRLRQEVQRLDQCTDGLFKAEVTHDQKRAIDETNLVPQRERTKDEDNPAIHYGTIASANELMKDATIRDKLATERNVLCFEMEAAGLMNHFPCLVIRGICDYLDSHINKAWQGYAAMVAAAYAKDLLKTITPDKVEAKQKLKDVAETINQG